MIKKELINVKELNRKINSRAQLKPSLDAFPVKDISIPFNSMRNRHGIMDAELDVPQSFKDETLGVGNQIADIVNGNIKNDTENITENIKLNIISDNSLETNEVNSLETNEVNSNQNFIPSESPVIDDFLNDIEDELSQTRDKKPYIDNKFLRSIMDIKRRTTVSKSVIVIFLIVMAILIFFGFHKNI